MDTTVFETAWIEGQALAEAEATDFALDYLQTAYAIAGMTQVTASQQV